MGTPWRITVYAVDTFVAHRAIDSAYARIERVEQSMSDYRPDSEINRLASLPARQWYPVSTDLYTVLRFSEQLHMHSDGAFDVTIGTLTKRWRRAIRQQHFPENAIRGARTPVRSDYHLGRSGQSMLMSDSILFDLGGVAKGYALDVAGDVLRDFGIDCFLIDGGGDLLLGSAPPDRAGWTVALPSGPLDTTDVAIATSGPDYRYLLHEGVRYSHLLDPRTGLGVTHGQTVTVFAPTGMVADGLASALSVRTTARSALIQLFPATTYRVMHEYIPIR
ncbi:FAD:protein FMN transferase [Neolewinella maritima]|uniref:FAD:protein FMN transferase n=2 Tax=Neolewinella maritima TaxID=1383882 RepID=A0ABN8FC81_9BACT|nr:FAD:protein FMN transferase [Neolewinella maritima]